MGRRKNGRWAAAYLKAESYANASNSAKAAAGRSAMKAIANGAPIKKTIAKMERDWSAAANGDIWR